MTVLVNKKNIVRHTENAEKTISPFAVDQNLQTMGQPPMAGMFYRVCEHVQCSAGHYGLSTEDADSPCLVLLKPKPY